MVVQKGCLNTRAFSNCHTERSDLKVARTSDTKSAGCSQAAKCVPDVTVRAAVTVHAASLSRVMSRCSSTDGGKAECPHCAKRRANDLARQRRKRQGAKEKPEAKAAIK
jgi:hypothetical protein